ncbi:MAG: TetR/AcrR family transcriptional regulator [Chloroflexota bacterium]
MKDNHDRQTQRTQLLLGNALIELMMEKGYDGITVKDIIERANVGRSTFYSHYQSKDDLFNSQFDRVLEVLTGHTGDEISAENPYFPSLGLFRHVQEQYKLFKILAWGTGADLMIRHFQKSLSEKIERRLMQTGQAFALPTAVMATFITGSFLSMLQWWLDNKMVYSPEEIDKMFQSLAMPGIEKAVMSL